MTKLPNSSLTLFDLQRFVDADLRRSKGQVGRYDNWDVSSSQYGVPYLALGISHVNERTRARFMGAFGRYLVEVRGFLPPGDVSGGDLQPYGIFFRYLVHTPFGTISWESEDSVLRSGRKGFLACEKAAISALSLVDVLDMFGEEFEEIEDVGTMGRLVGPPYRP